MQATSLRTLGTALGLVVALLGSAADSVQAEAITYTLAGISDGSIDGVPFVDEPYVITFVGDTTDVQNNTLQADLQIFSSVSVLVGAGGSLGAGDFTETVYRIRKVIADRRVFLTIGTSTFPPNSSQVEFDADQLPGWALVTPISLSDPDVGFPFAPLIANTEFGLLRLELSRVSPSPGTFDAVLGGGPDVLFRDSFESGDTSAWTLAVP